MALLRGEDLNVGVGVENPSARGVNVVAQKWVPGRSPTGITVEVIKSLLKETKASGVMSQGSNVMQRRASGPLEFNVRSESIGYWLKSLLGKSTPSVVAGSVNDHLFEVLINNPQFPTLTVLLSQPLHQDYEFPGALCKSIEFRTPVDDLVNATVEIVAFDQEESGDTETPTFDATDYIFRPYDVEIKLATNLAGLAAASAINVKEFSVAIANNGREQQHIGSVIPTDTIAGLIEIAGNLVLDYEDDTYNDLHVAGTYKAMQIKMTRSDIDIGGGSNPTITIQLAKVSFEASSPDRPIDDIVRDSLDFTAHYSDDDSEAINIVVRNTVDDYDYDVVT